MAKSEKLTTISFCEGDVVAIVHTYNVKLHHRLIKLANDRPDECKLIQKMKDGAIEYAVPQNWIRIDPPHTRNVSDEEREVLVERLRLARLAKEG